MDKADEQKRIDRLYADNKAAFEAAQESANKGDWQYFEKVPMDKADEQPTITQADELLREIFLHGHSEGWTGNQTRRDVQHVDAEKGWSLYVSNGALEKTIARKALEGKSNG